MTVAISLEGVHVIDSREKVQPPAPLGWDPRPPPWVRREWGSCPGLPGSPGPVTGLRGGRVDCASRRVPGVLLIHPEGFLGSALGRLFCLVCWAACGQRESGSWLLCLANGGDQLLMFQKYPTTGSPGGYPSPRLPGRGWLAFVCQCGRLCQQPSLCGDGFPALGHKSPPKLAEEF